MNVISLLKSKFQWFYAIKLFSSLTTQLASFFLVYLFTPAEYGELALVLTVAQFMYILVAGWTEPTIVNLGTKAYAEKGVYTHIVIFRCIIVFASLCVVSGLYLIMKPQVLLLLRGDEYFFPAYILFVALCLFSLTSQLLYPCRKNALQSSSELIVKAFMLIVILMWVRTINQYIAVNLIFYALYAIVITAIFVKLFRRAQFSMSIDAFKNTLVFSVWQIMGALGIYFTNIGVNYVFSLSSVTTEDIGLYNFAYKLYMGFTPVFAICVIIIPQWIFNSKDKATLVRSIPKRIVSIMVALSAAYLLLGMFMKPFLSIIGKYDYVNSITYFYGLFPSFVFLVYSQMMDLIIMTTSSFKHIQYATLIQGAVLIAMCIVLVNGYGVEGALVSVFTAMLLKSIYLTFIYVKSARHQLLNQ